jgi:hypothetical protein
MSATAARPRKTRDQPTPVPFSVAMLAARVRAVGRALHAHDEAEARSELRALADAALLLSRQHPLRLSPLDQRTRIAIERDPMKRGG